VFSGEVLPGFPGLTYAECFIRGAHLDRGYERGRNAACLADQGPARFSDRPLALESRNARELVKKSSPEKSEEPNFGSSVEIVGKFWFGKLSKYMK